MVVIAMVAMHLEVYNDDDDDDNDDDDGDKMMTMMMMVVVVLVLVMTMLGFVSCFFLSWILFHRCIWDKSGPTMGQHKLAYVQAYSCQP